MPAAVGAPFRGEGAWPFTRMRWTCTQVVNQWLQLQQETSVGDMCGHEPTWEGSGKASDGRHRWPDFFFFLNFIFFYFLCSRFLLVIYFIHISVYMSIPISQFIPPPPPAFPPWCPCVCSLHLCLYFCLANRFICTIFLDSTYMH